MNKDIKSLLLTFNQKPIAYHKAYTQITGKLTAGVMLSQLMYWWSSVNGREFYKTDDELREETGLSKEEIKSAKKTLVSKGFITYKLKGIPAKTHYIINIEKIINELTSLWKSHQLDSGNPTNSVVEIPPTITENTQENTTYIKNSDKSENKGFKPKLAMKYVARFNELYSCRQTLTPARMKSYKARAETFGEEAILIALENMATRPFFRGENSRNWVPDIAWLIKSDDNVNKLLSPAKPIKKSLEERLKEEIPDAQIF